MTFTNPLIQKRNDYDVRGLVPPRPKIDSKTDSVKDDKQYSPPEIRSRALRSEPIKVVKRENSASAIDGKVDVAPATRTAPTRIEVAVDATSHAHLLRAEALLASKHAEISFEQFALMNNTYITNNSKYGKGNWVQSGIQSYLHLVGALKNKNDQIIELENPDIFLEIEKHLNDLLKGFQGQKAGDPVPADMETHSTSLYTHIQRQLDAQNYAYVSFDYSGKKHAHAVCCRFDRNPVDKSITLHFLNLGQGVQYHPELGFTTTNITPSYSFYPMTISEDNWKVFGKLYLGYTANLQGVAQIEDDDRAQHTVEHFYDLVMLFGTPNPGFLVKHAALLAAKFQITADCTEKSIRNSIFDFLTRQKKLKKSEIEKIFLNLHITSDISAYNAFALSKSPDKKEWRILLTDACEQLTTHLLRAHSEGIIKHQEKLDITLLAHLILSKLEKEPVVITEMIKTPHDTTFKTTHVPIMHPYVLRKMEDVTGNSFSMLPVFNPKTFRTSLEQWILTLDRQKGQQYEIYHAINESLSKLPPPRPQGEKDLWNEVPPEDCLPILHCFQKLHHAICNAGQNDGATCAQKTLLRFTLYALYDKIARLEYRELQGFASPTILEKYEPLLTFPRGEEGQRFCALIDYFTSQKKGGADFMPMQQGIDLKTLSSTLVGANFERFLRQFQGASMDIGSLFVAKLPDELKFLYFLALETHNAPLQNELRQETEHMTTIHHDTSMKFQLVNDGQVLLTNCCSQGNLLNIALGHTRFEPYYYFWFAGSTTNEVVLHKDFSSRRIAYQKNNKYVQKLCEELFRIAQKPDLRLPLAISWMHQHIMDLNIAVVQEMLWTCFFTPGVLEERIRNHPDTIGDLRGVIDQGFKHCGDRFENLHATVFLMQCSILFEERIASFMGGVSSPERLMPLRKTLQQHLVKVKGNVDEELNLWFTSILLESYLELKTETKIIDAYIHLFELNLEYLFTRSLRNNFLSDFHIHQRLLNKLKHVVDTAGGNKEVVFNRIINGICSHFLKVKEFQNLSWKWIGYSRAESNDLIIDFVKGIIWNKHSNLKLVKMTTNEMSGDPLPQQNFRWYGRVSQSSDIFIPGHSTEIYLLPDARSATWHRDSSDKVIIPAKKDGRGFAFSQVSVDRFSRRKFPILNDYDLVLESENVSQKELVLIGTRRWEKKAHCRFVFKANTLECTRMDENGKVLKLTNLKTLPSNHRDYAFTLALAKADEQICFVNENDEIEELTFRTIGMSFKRNGSKLMSNQFPGYAWTPMRIAALGEISNQVIVLQNDAGKIKVVFPFPNFEKFDLGKGEKSKLPHMLGFGRIRNFDFDLNDQNEPITGRNLSEKLFLIYFFRAHGEIETALQRLSELRPPFHWDEDALECLWPFFKTQNHSPRSLAFNMKFACFLAERFSEQKNPKIKEHLAFWMHKTLLWHVIYLRALGDDKYGGISKKYRIEEGDEARFLSIFVREKIGLPKILQIREELLNTVARAARNKYIPQTIDLSPFAYGALRPPSRLLYTQAEFDFVPPANTCPVRYKSLLSRKELSALFTTLYTFAKQTRKGELHEFDFILLALLRVSDGEDLIMTHLTKTPSKLSQVLFYVRHFPEMFVDCDFSPVADAKDYRKTFEKICARVAHIESLPSYQTFVDTVVKRKIKFDYQAEVVATMPEVVKPSPLPPPKKLVLEEQPFGPVQTTLFETKNKPRELPRELFDARMLSKPTPEEQEILAKFERGLKLLKEEENVVYVKRKENVQNASRMLAQKETALTAQVEGARLEITDLLNNPYVAFPNNQNWVAEMDLRLHLIAGQTYHLSPEMVMERVILQNDAAFLKTERAMLNDEQIQTIVQKVHHYYVLLMTLEMTREALKLVDKSDAVSENALLEILNYKFDYSPEKYPEIAYFKMKVGKHPRRSQIAIHIWVAEGMDKREPRLYSAKAGDGKSSYNIPLEILRGQRYPLMASVLTTEEMFDVYAEDLGATLNLLGIQLQLLRIGMQDSLTPADCERIYQDNKNNVRRQSALLMTPQTPYALELHARHAQIESTDSIQEVVEMAFTDMFAMLGKEDPVQNAITEAFTGMFKVESSKPKEKREEALSLYRSMKLFKEKSWVILDESHRTADPTTQAILGMGELVALARNDLLLVFELVKPLVGIKKAVCDNGRTVADLARLKDATTVPKEEDVHQIRHALARHMAEILLEKLPKAHWGPYLLYWTRLDAKMPSLEKLPQEAKHAVLLVRNFLIDLLPKILTMRTDFDHMAFEQEGEIDAPAHHKTLTMAQYEDPYLTTPLSIKGTMQRGLKGSQVLKLILSMRALMEDERAVATSSDETPSNVRFLKWTGVNLYEANVHDSNQVASFVLKLKKNHEAIEFYLLDAILPNVCYAKEKMTLSPAHLANMFLFPVVMSATPMTPLAHPVAFKAETNSHLNETFETQVVVQALQKQNQTVIHPANPAEFFSWLKLYPERFENVRALIDSGGFFCDEFNFDVAKKWLEASRELDGVLYCKDAEGGKGQNLCLLLRQNWRVIEFKKGSDKIETELAAMGIRFAALELATLFGSAHAESLNIILKQGVRAILFAGDTATLPHVIQGFMRPRGILTENMQQSIIWAVPPDLRDKIGKNFSISALLTWLLKNDARKQKELVILRAFQAIIQRIESLARDPVTNAMIVKYGKGIKERVEPTSGWEGETELRNTPDVLRSFAEAIYDRFGFDASFASQKELLRDLGLVIDQTARKVPQISTSVYEKASRNYHRKMIQKTKQVRVQKQFKSQEFQNVKPMPLKKLLCITDPKFTEQFRRENSVRVLFNEPRLTDDLYIEPNQFHTASQSGLPLGKEYLKEIDCLLIVLEGNNRYAIALSNDTAAEYMKKMVSKVQAPVKHKCFMLRADGVMMQVAGGTLAPTKAEIEAIRSFPWLDSVLSDVALFNGRLLFTEIFKVRLSMWQQSFMNFALSVFKALPNKEDNDLQSLITNLQLVLKQDNMLKLNFNK